MLNVGSFFSSLFRVPISSIRKGIIGNSEIWIDVQREMVSVGFVVEEVIGYFRAHFGGLKRGEKILFDFKLLRIYWWESILNERGICDVRFFEILQNPRRPRKKFLFNLSRTWLGDIKHWKINILFAKKKWNKICEFFSLVGFYIFRSNQESYGVKRILKLFLIEIAKKKNYKYRNNPSNQYSNRSTYSLTNPTKISNEFSANFIWGTWILDWLNKILPFIQQYSSKTIIKHNFHIAPFGNFP